MTPIRLIGYRGTGKSTVGARLAQQLGWPFYDADAELETDAGCTIREIFATEGEASFRDRETATLTRLVELPKIVLATGGGAILRESNRTLLTRNAFVVWLELDAESIWHRLQTDPTTIDRRPNLTHGGLDEIVELLRLREPFYAATAHARFHAAQSPELLASHILEAYRVFCPSNSVG